jgi:hypothetical protein
LAAPHRPTAVAIGLLVVLEAAAVILLAAAFDFDAPAVAHFGSLFDNAPSAAELLRWGALLDVGGYVAFGWLMIYVGQRLWAGRELVVSALTVSGLGGLLVGATGAALLATVGPSLLLDFRAAPDATRDGAVMSLELLGRAVSAGLWGTIVFGLLGAWLTGVGWLTRNEGPFSLAALVAGVGMLASSLRTGVTGRILAEVDGPLDAVLVIGIVAGLSLLFIWLLWLGLHLWPEKRAHSPA